MVHRILRLIGGVEIVVGAVMMIWSALPLAALAWFFIATGAVIILIELPGIWRDGKAFLQRLPLGGPIRWNVDGFLGCSWREGEVVYVACFQTNGRNVRRSNAVINAATITSRATGQTIPVLLKTDKGYVQASETNGIPSGATVYAHALFYDPKLRRPEEREGLPEDRFMADWGAFDFLVDYGARKFRHSFTRKDIAREIERVKPTLNLRPRITRKDV